MTDRKIEGYYLPMAINPTESRARYSKPLGKTFDASLAIALSYSSAEDQLTALYELDARSGFEHHSSLEPTMQALESEVGA